jgi:hypothetical protein
MMKNQTDSSLFYLASSITKETLVVKTEQQLHSILISLEECHAALITSGDRETANLVSVAILGLRLKLCRIADVELKALCDVIEDVAGLLQDPKSPQARRGHPDSLKLID